METIKLDEINFQPEELQWVPRGTFVKAVAAAEKAVQHAQEANKDCARMTAEAQKQLTRFFWACVMCLWLALVALFGWMR